MGLHLRTMLRWMNVYLGVQLRPKNAITVITPIRYPLDNCGYIYIYISGWWYTYPSEKSWSSSVGVTFPNLWKVIKFHGSSHHQPDMVGRLAPGCSAFATALAKSLVLSVFPVPAGPAGAQPMHKCKAWRRTWFFKGSGWSDHRFFWAKKGKLVLQKCRILGLWCNWWWNR